MAKIRLGQTPKNFKRKVSFKLADGSDASIEITYKYRTRSEYGEFIDSMVKAAGNASKEVAVDENKVWGDLMAKIADSKAEHIVQIAEGWNLDEEFTINNIRQLADEFPEAAESIIENYRFAVTAARLGN